MSSSILVIGSLNMDLVVQVPRHPLPGETLLGSAYATVPGGKGANQAVAAARAGGPIELFGLVGNDAFGTALRLAIATAGVNLEGVSAIPGPSGIALIAVAPNGENTIIVSPGANAQLHPDRLDPQRIRQAHLLVVQLEIPLETVQAAIAIATQHAIPVLLNAAPAQPLDADLLQHVTYLVVNASEAALLTDRPPDSIDSPASAAIAARHLQERGVGTAIVTLGDSGLVWASEQGEGQMPAFAVEAVDTTAAGDAFCGALATALGAGKDLSASLRFANAAGAIAVTKSGAQPSLPTRAEIDRFLQQSR
jgi:ribokinase